MGKGGSMLTPTRGSWALAMTLSKMGRKKERSNWFAKDFAVTLPFLSFIEVAGDEKGVAQAAWGERCWLEVGV